MSSEVKRYKLRGSMPDTAALFLPDEVVSAADYSALKAERERLQQLIAGMVARYFANPRLDAELDQYLSGGIAQLEAERDALRAEAEALWSTYSALVDKLGIDTEKAKTADGKPSDVIVGYVEALRAENGRLREERDSFQREGIRAIEELDSARGLLRESREAYAEAIHWEDQQPVMKKIDAFLTATPAPEVQAKQGERQEAVAWIVPDFGFLFPTEDAAQRYLRNINDLRKPTALYTAPQPGPDVRALVEALEQCAASLAWNCFGECRAIHAGPIMPAAKALDTARAALAAHRQEQPK